MPQREHRYRVQLVWTGDLGQGTRTYQAYSRRHELRSAGKPAIAGSSDPVFRGDADRWSPEDLLIGSLAACHQLWYLHLCADAGIVVLAYEDQAEGILREQADGAGEFERVTLRPRVTLARGADLQRARALHAEAHERCFIARSVRFPVDSQPTILLSAE